jgi:ribonuclease P protein component
VYARGSIRIEDALFQMRVKPNDRRVPRLGLAVAVKAAGSAVARNRVRRMIRESFRLQQRALPAVDIVVSIRPRASAATPAALRASLADLWTKVAQKCAISSAR